MNILITGASQGIGKELVKQFAKDKKVNVIAIARSNDKLNELKKYCLTKYSNSIDVVSMDVSNPKSFSSFKIVLKKYSNIDVLINNAGLLINKPIQDISTSEVEELYKTNVFGAINIVKVLLSNNVIRNSHIINIGSMGGYQGASKFNGLSIYSSTKAALANLSECWAVELSDLNIKSNCLALGAVETEMLMKAFPNYKAELKAVQIAVYIKDFAFSGLHYFNGKVLPVSFSTP